MKHAFIGSFRYIIYAVLYPLLIFLGTEGLIKLSYELILGLLVLYMLLSALRVGIAFIWIFKSDLKMYFSNVENEQKQKEECKEEDFDYIINLVTQSFELNAEGK